MNGKSFLTPTLIALGERHFTAIAVLAFAAFIVTLVFGLSWFAIDGLSAALIVPACILSGFFVGRWQIFAVATPEGRTGLAAGQSDSSKSSKVALSGADDLHLSNDVERLRLLAKQDSLTGLNNRSHFKQVVAKCMQSAEPGSPHCLLFIDMDGFKQINDALGHSQGDKLLVACADRLRLAAKLDFPEENGQETARVEIARFGGDEFVLFVGNAGSGNTAQRLAKRILRVLSDPFHLGVQSVQVGASIGVAFAPDHGEDYDELLRKADAAMYQAKRLGRNRCEFYSVALLENARQAEREENEVREAFARGELELHFQPLFDARTMEVCSAEALLRWRHPRRGLLLPGDFFAAIDRSNMSAQIGEWVINEATRRIAELERAGTPLMIAANVSPTHLENLEFPSLVRSCINRWQCSAKLLQLEITEDAAMRDPDMTARSLGRLNDVGVSVAIDDFGTGYSNLANLIMLPISRLKIDRSLLQSIEDKPEAYVLVQTIINLSNSLGFHSVAEGVESEDQQRILQSMGCDVLQGFLFSRAISFEKLKLLCRNTAQRSGQSPAMNVDHKGEDSSAAA
ncbi:hypothetical protein EH31_05440 [Erythrobacter longus]|uniref:Diguanylate cyclase n=1 Tax=Erythrobacter longus TaxID=1044 RepID=A0A074N2I9_ERYLO|nr:hypothetical protein EH31_05440 [Erythrobacter longus]